MTQETVHEIDEGIRLDKKHVELDKALERLVSSRDFKTVILQGYLEDEAIRLVHLKADPSMGSPERQATVIRQIDAIGDLFQYFRTIGRNATMAQRSIESAEAERESLMAEEVQRG